MKEKLLILPEENNIKEIRSPIVLSIHDFEQSLNAEVIRLREQIKTERKNNRITPFIHNHETQLRTTKQNLKLFRETFSSYLPQIEKQPQTQKEKDTIIPKLTTNKTNDKPEEDQEYVIFS